MFYLVNEKTEKLARHDTAGEHDGKVTTDLALAAKFSTRRAAVEFAANFGPDWYVLPAEAF